MYTVQCDFDDTVSVGIVSKALMARFFPGPDWRDIEREFLSGRISVEECNRQQFARITVTEAAIAEFVADSVQVRPGFVEMVEYCRLEGMKVVVVSSGVDVYIRPVLQRLGLMDLEMHAGLARFTSSGIAVDYKDPSGADLQQGFKLTWLRHMKGQGRPVVYVGDSESDFAPALEADHVLARSELKELLQSAGVPHTGFGDFHDVLAHVRSLQMREP